jgi:DNA helicase-2/ATP-dependent DNA helicase PcrA
MAWDSNLSDEQKIAASYTGSHARLLAGPGTGKTRCFARRIVYLVIERGISPSEILATTFTRAAAFELRKQASEALGDSIGKIPRISTLHSFSLRQLLRNVPISDLPQPLRVADDYEERWIIIEDLKDILSGDYDVDKTWDILGLLSADWETLKADQSGWESKFPDPHFITAWHAHRDIYGYTLRAELVYQLKKALELNPNFQLEGPPRYFLVDEYQDLNPCDLAVIKTIVKRGAELYGAGDDDQSIYGFRKAYPQGIRMFDKDYKPSTDLKLEVSWRCDRRILDFAHYVAEQDIQRIPKPLIPAKSAGRGIVQARVFANQEEEATGISKICKSLLDSSEYVSGDILILLRQDYRQRFSTPIRAALEREQIPTELLENPTAPLDEPSGRQVLCMVRLLENPKDDLAWRTLLQIRHQGVGRKTIKQIYEIARSRGIRFTSALDLIAQGQEQILRARTVQEALQNIKACLAALESRRQGVEIAEFINIVTQEIIANTEERAAVKGCLDRVAVATDAKDIKDLLVGLQISLGRYEQDSGDVEKVRIMTMHQAKGLTSPVVIIAVAEDEYIPGKATGLEVDDERRLLYVSLTRAKNHLYITYCNRRGGAQRHTGRNPGSLNRTFTRFLRDIPKELYDKA